MFYQKYGVRMKKISIIKLLSVVILTLMITACSGTKDVKTESPAQLLEFDKKTWDDFKKLYIAHNKLMNAISRYSEGKIDRLKFYNYCKDTEEYFMNYSANLRYGTTEEQEDYLFSFTIFALSDQRAAQFLMNYLNNNSVKDLSKAQEEIQNAKKAALMIAQNRGVLLNKAGLNQEEIKKKIDSEMEELSK